MGESHSMSRTGFGGKSAVLACAAMAMLMVGCASPVADQGLDQGEGQGARQEEMGQTSRVARQLDFPLLAASSAPATSPLSFQAPGVRGTLAPTGDWTLRVEVAHPRLRCASYAVGLRFGSGNADCSSVDWSTPTAFASPRPQCNNASQIHTSSGTLGTPATEIAALNCARVVVRCTGACN